MLSGTPTQNATSVADVATLAGLDDTPYKDGELAYVVATVTYYRVNRTNNTGIPTKSGWGSWTVFASGAGAAAALPLVLYVAPGTTPAGPTGSIENPFGTVTAAVAYAAAHGGANPAGWSILVSPGVLNETLTIPANFFDLTISALNPLTTVWTAPANQPCVQWTGAAQNYAFFQFNGFSFLTTGAATAHNVSLNGLATATAANASPLAFFTDCNFNAPAGADAVNAQQIGVSRFLRCEWFPPAPLQLQPISLTNCDRCQIDDCALGGDITVSFDPTVAFANSDTTQDGELAVVNGSIVQTVTLVGAPIFQLDPSSSINGGLVTTGLLTYLAAGNNYFPQLFVRGTLGLFTSAPTFSATILTPAAPAAGATLRPLNYDFSGCRLNGTLNFTAAGTLINNIDMRGAWVLPAVATAVSVVGTGLTVDLRQASINPGKGSPLVFVGGQVTATAPAVAIVSKVTGTSNLLPGNPAPNQIVCACPFVLATSEFNVTLRILGTAPGTFSVPPGVTVIPGVSFAINGPATDTSDFYWEVVNN